MKKYENSIKRRTKEIVGNYIRYGIICFVWCLLVFYAIQVDKEFYNQSGGYFSGLVAFFKEVGHAWGISYNLLYNTLGGYSGILLAVIGMIITGWLSFSDRLEKEVYGIRRRELFSKSQLGKWQVDSFIGIFFMPPWMVYVLIRRYCFAAYFIMALIFVQFILSNIMLAKTYSRNQDYIRINKKITYSIRKAVGAEEFGSFGELLDRVEVSIDGNTDWKEVNTLFLDCIGKAKIKEEYELYRISREFLTVVYAKRNKERIVDLAIFCIQEINRGYKIGNEEKTKLAYWTVLDCLYQSCAEEQISLCVNKLLDLFSLNGVSGVAGINLPVAWIEEIFAIAALQTEYWLRSNNSRQKSFGETFNKMIRLGEAVYLSEKRCERILNFIAVRQSVLKEIDGRMYRCFVSLKESYLTSEKSLHIGSLLEYASKII